jgi:hypothetical protein
MIIKRKLYSVMDEEGNIGYYHYDESTGEEKLFSAVVEEEERVYASVRKLKKAGKMLFDKSLKGKLTTKDLTYFNHLKGKNSIKATMNPKFDKVAKGTYNKVNKLTKGEFGKSISKPEYINQSRSISVDAAKSLPMNPKKGQAKEAVDALNLLSNR